MNLDNVDYVEEENLNNAVNISIATSIVILPYLSNYIVERKRYLRHYITTTPAAYMDAKWIKQQEKIIELIEDDIRSISLV